MWSKDWWSKALNRAIRSFAQGALTGIGTCALMQDVNWLVVLSSATLMFIVSILTSIALGLPEFEEDGTEEIDEVDEEIEQIEKDSEGEG